MFHDYLKFVIVGHVDHGKSTLIGRLLYDTNSVPQEKIEEVKTICASLGRNFEFSYLMDYMEEEREKNITIDTTQTFFKTVTRDYVIIDAPGHKEFLKNMITGSSQAQAALLIIDAKEGVMEQTKRHAYMLKLLNVSQIILLINKMDLVDYHESRYKEVCSDILNHLTALKLRPVQIIPISAWQGENIAKKSDKINWYQGPTVLEALNNLKPPVKIGDLPLRFPVQDIYNIDNEKILVGQIESGRIKKNQEILILPDKILTKVKSIKKWKEDLAEVETGHSIGLIIDDDLPVKRGQIICETDSQPKAMSEFQATIFWMSAKVFTIAEKITFKCVTQETMVKIKSLNKLMESSSLEIIKGRTDEIRPTEVAEVTFVSTDKIVIDNFNQIPEMGRFVLVKGDDIVAGGIITNL